MNICNYEWTTSERMSNFSFYIIILLLQALVRMQRMDWEHDHVKCEWKPKVWLGMKVCMIAIVSIIMYLTKLWYWTNKVMIKKKNNTISMNEIIKKCIYYYVIWKSNNLLVILYLFMKTINIQNKQKQPLHT